MFEQLNKYKYIYIIIYSLYSVYISKNKRAHTYIFLISEHNCSDNNKVLMDKGIQTHSSSSDHHSTRCPASARPKPHSWRGKDGYLARRVSPTSHG